MKAGWAKQDSDSALHVCSITPGSKKLRICNCPICKHPDLGGKVLPMSKRMIFSLLTVLAVSLSTGCCGHDWRIGIYRDNSCCNNACCNAATPCQSCAGDPGFCSWYPCKHLFRGLHHLGGLFTCYGCGGNYWGNGDASSSWAPISNSPVYEGNLEPIPTPSDNLKRAPKDTPKDNGAGKTIQQTSYRVDRKPSPVACNCATSLVCDCPK